jgi:phosphoglycolate phosphatase-like HAD superfamily hydrolase
MHYAIDKLETLLWDFDGVILDSMVVRDIGFERIFEAFPKHQVDELLDFHRTNGGWSRYIKIEHFFKNIAKIEFTQEDVLKYAANFSVIMKKELINPTRLIADAVDYIKAHYMKQNFHIVSGSDHTELNFLCKELDLARYFISIHGSPTAKTKLVSDLLSKHSYNNKTSGLIGDSINDRDAAEANDISFYGYNNKSLGGANYVKKLKIYI